jgi:hypothetical protein
MLASIMCASLVSVSTAVYTVTLLRACLRSAVSPVRNATMAADCTSINILSFAILPAMSLAAGALTVIAINDVYRAPVLPDGLENLAFPFSALLGNLLCEGIASLALLVDALSDFIKQRNVAQSHGLQHLEARIAAAEQRRRAVAAAARSAAEGATEPLLAESLAGSNADDPSIPLANTRIHASLNASPTSDP